MGQSNNDEATKPKKRVLPNNPLTGKPRLKTWKEKLADGDKLNHLEDAQADADFNFKERQRAAKARADFDARKARSGVDQFDPESTSVEDDE
jgi:hypothetical protein